MKRIKLTNFDMYALVDDEDYEELSKHTWHLTKRGYAARSYWIPERKTNGTIYMHRAILGTSKGLDTEHGDQNKLNNQKWNLRPSTRSENMANIRARSGLSKYKGVSFYKRKNMKKPWVAYIKKDYKNHHLGYFATENEAARAYNAKAVELFGEFSSLNEVPEKD